MGGFFLRITGGARMYSYAPGYAPDLYAARYAPGNAAELFWRGEHRFDRTAEVGRPSLSTPGCAPRYAPVMRQGEREREVIRKEAKSKPKLAAKISGKR